ncbi:hypothetical protein D1AOALGA4SA_1973 [Olavius algarvensis Delta 1 endosymbiont]|nr:hypothetical protein D1AOALGA4SA_1973 [Olavius algarvensis Delta 1 endosymbiont]
MVANYEDNVYNRHFLGPIKAGAYLSSGIPVIFSDLPSLRARFSEEFVYFAKSESINAWVEKIEEIVKYPEIAKIKASKAKNFVENKTFTKAAKEILTQLNSCLYGSEN